MGHGRCCTPGVGGARRAAQRLCHAAEETETEPAAVCVAGLVGGCCGPVDRGRGPVDRGPGPARGRHRDNFSEDVKDEWELSKRCVCFYTCVFIQSMCDVCVHMCVCMCMFLCDHVYIDFMCMCVWALRQHSGYKSGGPLSPTLCRPCPGPGGAEIRHRTCPQGPTGPHS